MINEDGTVKTCETCGSAKDVHFTTDPYQEDVYNEEVWGFWCPDCLYASASDI